MKAFLLALVSALQHPFNRDMERCIHCQVCSAPTLAERFRCQHCRSWTRSPVPQIASLVVFVLSTAGFTFYCWKLVPTLAEMEARVSRVLPRPIQLAVWLSHVVLWDGIYVAGLPIAGLIYLAFLWRPHRRTGPSVVLILALAVAFALAALYLLSLQEAEMLYSEALVSSHPAPGAR